MFTKFVVWAGITPVRATFNAVLSPATLEGTAKIP
jgi:hypothetical protein